MKTTGWMMAAVLVLSGCGGSSGGGSDSGAPAPIVIPPPPPVLVSLHVSPPTALIAVGATANFAATGTMSDGSSISVAVTWTSSNNAVATVSTSGLALGVTSGSVQVTASAVSNPALTDSATLTVQTSQVLYAHGSYRGVNGLFRFPSDGSTPTTLTMTGAAPPTVASIYGIAQVGRTLYLLQANSNGVGLPSGRLYAMNLDTSEVTTVLSLPTTAGQAGGYQTLTADSQGQLYVLDVRGPVYRINPATATATSMGSVGNFNIAADVDSQDRPVVQMIFSGDIVRRGANAWTTVLSTGLPAGGGLATAPNGDLYVYGGYGGTMLRGLDVNGDGDFLDASEVATCITSIGDGGQAGQHLLVLNGSLLVNAQYSGAAQGGLYLYTDNNSDGDLDDAGERVEWNSDDVYSSGDFSNMRRGTP